MSALASYLQAGVADRHGASGVAANHMRAALADLDWDDSKVIYEDDWKVYIDEVVETMVAYVDADNERIVVSQETWDILCCDVDASDQFLADMTAGGSGMRFIVVDREPFRSAVREHARQKGNHVTKGKDAITQLTEQANALVVQAASLNTAPTSMQQQVFAVRYAQLQEQMTQLEDRMDALRGLLNLAGTALYDTTR